MKKLLILMMSVLLLCCTGCSKKEEEVIVEPEPEPLYYSMDINVITTKDINSVEELAGKKIAVEMTFDKEYSEYAIEQLKEAGLEITDDNLYVCNYRAIKEAIDAGAIDAWIVPGNREDTIKDYRSDYVSSDYHSIATYNKPYYEEETIDTSKYVKELYSEPFMVMLNGLDGYGENSVHEWKRFRNDVNHILVVNPELKHVLIVSIPRDSYVTNQVTGYKDKFTHFCQNGPQNPANSISALLGIDPIPYYCMTSFNWFVYGINEIGGVTVDVPMDARLDMNSLRDVANPVEVPKGERNLYGEQALALARNRKYNGIVGNDNGRIRNQALILNSLIEKIAYHPYILDIVGMSWLMDYLCENNFSAEEKQTLFALAKTFEDGYTVDNFFLDGGGMYVNDVYYYGLSNQSLAIAKGKIDLVTTGSIEKDNPYYEEIMQGYVTGGAGTIDVGDNGFVGEYYDLADIFKF
ncbi:MAG: LCP family protein [Erysipelotrichaceae bacterium]|nr:LCP family protein [Erysipelotrichaceae bacterium]